MLTQKYESKLKERTVREFVETHKRVPTKVELRELLKSKRKIYTDLETRGFSSRDTEAPRFLGEAIAEQENRTRRAIRDDYTTLLHALKDFDAELEDTHRQYMAATYRLDGIMDRLESLADGLIITNKSIDTFVYTEHERFDTQDKIDHDLTDASIEGKVVTLGRQGYTIVDPATFEFKTSVFVENKMTGEASPRSLDSLKTLNGIAWEKQVYTDSGRGRVTLVLDVELDSPEDITDVALDLIPGSIGHNMKCTILVSTDGQDFDSTDYQEVTVEKGMNKFSVGRDAVKTIRFLLSKNKADEFTVTQQQAVYMFAIDWLAIYTDEYTAAKKSTLVAGPYKFYDEVGAEVFFSRVTVDACYHKPEGTGLAFYLSTDKSDWRSIDPDAGQAIRFGKLIKDGTYRLYDDDLSIRKLVLTPDPALALDYRREGLMNVVITSNWVDKISTHTLRVKRNLLQDKTIYGAPAGWFFDDETGQYQTTFYIADAAGVKMDFGSTSAVLNGNTITGEVFIAQGYHTLLTADANWQEVDSGAETEERLRVLDPLYPYNHKLMIEGYGYGSDFNGKRLYPGADEYFGQLLTYVPPEQFDSLGDTKTSVFTNFIFDDEMHFKVLVDKTDSSWAEELYEIEYNVATDNNNQVWVKAVLTTNAGDTRKSPRLDDFRLRAL